MALPAEMNWFLIFVIIAVALLTITSSLYILVTYMHPEDKNQAWFPKIIVVISLSVAVFQVLLFPLDVANRSTCKSGVVISACETMLPMTTLWYVVYFVNLGLAFVGLPFTMFFYEADSEYTLWMKLKSAAIWTGGVVLVIALGIGIGWGLNGKVSYPMQRLDSGLAPIQLLDVLSSINATCVPVLHAPNSTNPRYAKAAKPGEYFYGKLCDSGASFTFEYWKLTVSLPVYIMAIQSIIGWILFLLFGGVGMFAAPLDWIMQFLGRPKKVITKSQFISAAQTIAKRAKEVKEIALMLRRQDKDRKWRANFKKLQRQLQMLEGDEYQLDRSYPQGADGEVRWVVYQIGFILLLIMGVGGFLLSLAWVVHIIAYMLVPVPADPMLNLVFIELDKVFPLFGVGAFGGFCLYLMVIAMKGNFMLGTKFLFVNLYPMRPGATMMSSFCVNTSIILIMASAIIQFCAQAFSAYADSTAIFDVFGNQVMYLNGISWLYNKSFFLIFMLCISFLSAVYMLISGPKVWKGRRKPEDAYKF